MNSDENDICGQFLVRLHGEYNTGLILWKQHVYIYIIAKLSIRAYGSKALQ